MNRGNVGDRVNHDSWVGNAPPDPKGAENPAGADTCSQGEISGFFPIRKGSIAVNRGNVDSSPNVFNDESIDQPATRNNGANSGKVEAEMRDAAVSRELSVQLTNAMNSQESSIQFTADQTVSATRIASFSSAELATGAESGYLDLSNPDETPELSMSSGFSPESTRISVLNIPPEDELKVADSKS